MYPYSNFHDLNLDWMIKIAKDFLDQYTHIQETITDGLGEITNTKDDSVAELEQLQTEITAALNGWYDEHSADITTELEDALADLNSWFQAHSGYLNTELATNIAAFNAAADAKAASARASIPDDYTTFFDAAIQFRGPVPSNYTSLKEIHAPGIYYIGANYAIVPLHRDARFAGKSGYNVRKMFGLTFARIFSFSMFPIRVVTYMGILMSVISFIVGIGLIFYKIFGNVVTGWTSTIVLMLFLFGLNFAFLGVLGEYIGKVFLETKQRPNYIIEKIC